MGAGGGAGTRTGHDGAPSARLPPLCAPHPAHAYLLEQPRHWCEDDVERAGRQPHARKGLRREAQASQAGHLLYQRQRGERGGDVRAWEVHQAPAEHYVDEGVAWWGGSVGKVCVFRGGGARAHMAGGGARAGAGGCGGGRLLCLRPPHARALPTHTSSPVYSTASAARSSCVRLRSHCPSNSPLQNASAPGRRTPAPASDAASARLVAAAPSPLSPCHPSSCPLESCSPPPAGPAVAASARSSAPFPAPSPSLLARSSVPSAGSEANAGMALRLCAKTTCVAVEPWPLRLTNYLYPDAGGWEQWEGGGGADCARAAAVPGVPLARVCCATEGVSEGAHPVAGQEGGTGGGMQEEEGPGQSRVHSGDGKGGGGQCGGERE